MKAKRLTGLCHLNNIAETRNKRFVLKDFGNRVTINPTRDCQKIKVDGELMEIQPRRCDWCVRGVKEGDCLFIELKGRNWLHGLSQIECTISWFRSQIPVFSLFKECYIIMSSGVPSNNTTVQKEKIRFMRTYKSQLIMRHSGSEITF